MEGRIRILLLRCLLVSGCVAWLTSPALAADDEDEADGELPQVIEPEVERREIKEAKIDTEDFEIGAFAGFMSIEDFGVNPVYGAAFAYHITENFFVEASVGQSRAQETSFERLSGAAQLLTDEERDLTYYNISFGYNVLPGEVFIGTKRAFNQALYLTGGVGSTEFAGDERFTVSFGVGYRFLPTDFLAIHLEVKDFLFDMDLLGEQKTTHNIQSVLGLTFFF